jgi:hypothetical protein
VEVGVENPALLDLVVLSVEGLQVSLKDLPHQLGVSGDLELGFAPIP